MREKRYDVVHVHGNSGTMYFDIHAAKKSNIPVRIAHCHNMSCKFKLLHYMLKPFLNKEMTKGIACSEIAGKWVFTKDYLVLNNAINTGRFSFSQNKRVEIRKSLNLNENFVILNIGRLVEQKNQMFLIDLMPSIINKKKDAVLVLVGDGVLETKLRNRAMELDIADKVYFLGKRNDVESIYCSADCFAFPSIFEGLGLGLIEAQASGLKCIASINVPKEANAGELVTYVSLDCREEWIDWLVSHEISDYEIREKRSIQAIDTIKKNAFDIKENARELLKLY